MKVSEYFGLDKKQPYLDFVDVFLDTDLPVFVDPSRLRGLQGTWGSSCASLLQHFFDRVLSQIKNGKNQEAIHLLSNLGESNDFHLGLSKGKSRGRGLGGARAQDVWKALAASKAGKTGLLEDLEDTCLMIDGIGPDIISDAVCNIIRGPLIQYTQQVCEYHQIPLTPDIDSGPIWNPQSGEWEHAFVPLPMTSFGRLVLVPKLIVRHQISYSSYEYFQHYLLPHMQREELRLNTALVQTLANGNRRVTKKSLRATYGADKLAIIEQSIKHPDALKKYRTEKKAKVSRPIKHETLADLSDGIAIAPDFPAMYEVLRNTPTGANDATAYENAIENLLTALLYPSLAFPTKQYPIHQGRKRLDIKYVNAGTIGFFGWLSNHYACPHVFVECKNYSEDVGNPEIDQLAGRFSPSRGQVGLLVCRKIDDRKRLWDRCIDTAKDGRGYIIPLDDNDIAVLIEEYSATQEFPSLRTAFNRLIM